jgi:hypothetical protein
MTIKLWSLVGAIALLGMVAACTPQSSTPDPDPGSVSESAEGRAAYSEVPLPPADQRMGATPDQIALDVFGLDDPGEGNFAQEVAVVEETPTQSILTLTQTGLLDDSVEGMRYWLEFAPKDNQWELVWVGRQVRCRPNRGSQEWSTDLCS